jgi:hypothetical protein
MSGKRLALLVAADQFADPQLSTLQAPQADINALAELLADADIGGFTVERLVNGTSQELRLALNRLFGRRDPDDFCLLHVSSHGLKDASGELYLAATDTQREYLEATSVDASYLRRQMDHSRAGAVVVLLDCCYGGAFERGMVPRGDGDVDLSGTLVPVTEGRGRAVITASTAIEYAFEGVELRPGANPEPSIFTEAVAAGIRQGPADVDSSGVLTLSELFTFVSRRVRQRSAHQTPQWWLYGMSGELVIARNPNPSVTPKDLPADVAEVLRLPQPAARLGAVFALRTLVREGDPGSALTAYRTLETLAVDDSRQVSTAAAEVLAGVHTSVEAHHGGGASPAVSPVAGDQEMIDFGSVAVGQKVPPALIELGGALAPACKLEVRDAPVELTRRGLRAEVRLDTSTAATVDGVIEVVGPGGGAVVRVLARIGADIGAESSDTGNGSDAAPPAGAEVTVKTEPETDTEVAFGTAPETEAAADDHVRDPEVVPAQRQPAARAQSVLWRDSRLLIATWAVAAATLLAGLLPGGYGESWYAHLDPYLSPLSAIATPLALVGLQFAHAARLRMVMAIAVACTGAVSMVMATGLIAYAGFRQELVVEFIGASLTAVLGSVMAVRAYRAVSSGPAHAQVITTALLGILAAIVIVPAVSAVRSGFGIYPLVVGVCVVSAMLAVGLMLPLQSRSRVVLGAVFIGLLLSVTLYTVTPTMIDEAILLPVGCVIFSVVAFFHVRPFWRALDGRNS